MTVTPAAVAVALGRTAPEPDSVTEQQWQMWIDDAILLINARRSAQVQDEIRQWLDPVRFPQGVRVSIDIDPYSFV